MKKREYFFQKLLYLSLIEYFQMAEAMVFLLFSNILIFLVPFRWWQGWIGIKNRESGAVILDTESIKTLNRIRHNVRRANKILFTTSRCFAISLTIKKMLQIRGFRSTLCLGVKKGIDNNLLAHAWIKYGDMVVYGGQQADRHYAQLIFFS